MKTAIYQQEINKKQITILESETMLLSEVFNLLKECETLANGYGFGDTVMFWVVDFDNPDTVLVPPCLN